MEDTFNGKNILIVGGTGSWGQELTKQLLENYSPKSILIYSRGEHKQVEMQRKFSSSKLRFLVGDVRDKENLMFSLKGIDIVFHLAALKHVPVCEKNPIETLKTNILGTQNLIESAVMNNIDKFILVSTDKSVDPINTYGASKLLAEKLVINANFTNSNTKFSCIRAGNVLGSQGSVVPLFKNQIKIANEITVTDTRMTRFIMTLKQAINLVLKASSVCVGGEILVTKMPVIKLVDLVDVMADELGDENTKIKQIGIRPGEKLHEVLISKYESPRSKELDEFYIIFPTLKIEEVYKKWNHLKDVDFEEYNSKENNFLDQDEIRKLLKNEGWLNNDLLEKYSKDEILNLFKREGWLNE